MAIVFDASGSGYTGTPVGNNDFANFMTVGAGSERALLIGVACPGQTATFTITWDQGGTNQNVPQIGSYVNHTGGTGRVALYGVVAPTSGLKTLRVAAAGTSNEIFVFGIAVTGALATGGATTFANITNSSTSGNGSTSSLAPTGSAGDMSVVLATGPEVMSSPTQTQIFVNNSGSITSAGASRGSAGATHSWTFASAVNWLAIGLSIVSSGGGGGAVGVRFPLRRMSMGVGL